MQLKIAAYRKQHQLTQVELAKHLGISFQSISKWENGVNYPDIHMLLKLANFFNVTIDDLIQKEVIKNTFQRKDTSHYWDHALSFLEETRQDLWNDDYFEFLVKKVWCFKSPISIVDYGCGYGFLGMKLLPLLPEGSSYTGIDINKSLIEKAKNLFCNTPYQTHFVQADLYAYESDTLYDVSICQALLRHLNAPKDILKSMIKTTKVGGKVICIEVNRIIEAIGYHHPNIPYDPFVHLNVLEPLWQNEQNGGGRDYAIGIKLPSLFFELGLKNISTRLNDKVLSSGDTDDINRLKSTKGWHDEQSENHLNHFKKTLIDNKVDEQHIDNYFKWYHHNMELLNHQKNDMITFFRGLMIVFGDK